MKFWLAFLLTVVGPLAAAESASLLDRVAARLGPRATAAIQGDDAADSRVIATILTRPDPGTFFNRYVFGLQRAAAHVLSPDQGRALEQLIARYEPLRRRWHDERNTLRCKFNEVQWRYAVASAANAPALRRELERWMALRLEWTLRENLLYAEQDAAFWDLLDDAQRQHLLAGDWKAHAKLTTGHERANATARIVTSALGSPDDTAAFERTAAAWRVEREPLHRALMLAEHTARRVGFAMDLNSPVLIERVIARANDAYAKVYLAEADAYRRIVRAGYRNPAAASARAAADAWAEAPRRFAGGASSLIELLQPSVAIAP